MRSLDRVLELQPLNANSSSYASLSSSMSDDRKTMEAYI
jgi:hypothetical protein